MFNKKTTKLFALLLSCLLLGMMVLPVYADDGDTSIDDPTINRWTNVTNVQFKHDVDGNNLILKVIISGSSGTTYSNGTLKLTKSNGTLVHQWTGISSSYASFTIKKTITKPASGTYTLSLTITATRSGVSEVVSTSYTFTI